MTDLHRVVSSDGEELIIVDRLDNEIGSLSKAACHEGGGVLHRAFSLFLFNDTGELLLQRRASAKHLWPGFWSNSCCSHPRLGEALPIATKRRLRDELNIAAELEFVYHFCYQAQFNDAGSENELCHVYVGKVDGEIHPNDSEIASIRFISAADLSSELIARPHRYTPWFKQEWQALTTTYAAQLARYAI